MKKRIYCSLDLEGTGLDPAKDAITEVGAVLFEITNDGKIVFGKEFTQLVKPPIPIPHFIQNLTNIRDADVVGAPAWEDVLPSFRDFVGDHIIIGQNIRFDLNFLAAHGLPLPQAYIDTKELAEIFLPKAKFYNLEYLLRYFNVPLVQHHRALDDSKSAGLLLERIIDTFHQLPYSLQKQVADLLKTSNLTYRELFLAQKRSKQPEKPVPVGDQGDLFGAPVPHRPSGTPVYGDWSGFLSAENDFFVSVPAPAFQTELAQDLLAQADSASEGILLSCADQPMFEELSKKNPDWVLVDDPKNYLCPYRLSELVAAPKVSDAVRQFLIKLLVWRVEKETEENLSHLVLSGDEFLFRDLVCGDLSVCIRHQPTQKDCALEALLHRLTPDAKILTWHGSWMKYRKAMEKKMPRAIIWDAQAYESAWRSENTTTQSLKTIRGVVALLHDPEKKVGLLHRPTSQLRDSAARLLSTIDLSFGIMSLPFADAQFSSQRALDIQMRESDSFEKVRGGATALLAELDAFLDGIPIPADSVHPVAWLRARLSSITEFLRVFFLNPQPLERYWFDFFSSHLKLKSLSNAALQMNEFSRVGVVGMLGSDGVLAYYKTFFGLPEAEFREISSWRPQIILRTPEEPTHSRNSQSVLAPVPLLKKTLDRASSGRTIVLFSSQKSVEAAYESCAEASFKSRLIAQRVTGHQWKNAELYAAGSDTIWFLTTSHFLKHVRGLPATRRLILMRIPYEIPGIFESFYDTEEIFPAYIIPKTVMRINQLLSRFTQSGETGRQEIIFLDQRITREYNEPLLETFSTQCEIIRRSFDLEGLSDE